MWKLKLWFTMWKLKLVVNDVEIKVGGLHFWNEARFLLVQEANWQSEIKTIESCKIKWLDSHHSNKIKQYYKQQSSLYLPASHSEDGQGVVVTGCDQVGGGLGGDTGDNPLMLVISIRKSVRTQFRRDYHKDNIVRCDLTSYIMVLKSSQFPSFKHVVDLTGIIGTSTYSKFGTSRHTPSKESRINSHPVIHWSVYLIAPLWSLTLKDCFSCQPSSPSSSNDSLFTESISLGSCPSPFAIHIEEYGDYM